MPELDTGSTAWMLMATALVLFMTPGLAFFYGGMVRSKNVLGMLMQNFSAMGLMGVLWVLVAFSIAFGGDGSLFGNLDHIGFKDVGPEGDGIPFILFAAFQMTFAIITPALITGATADRFKYSAYMWFIGLWLVLVYAPVAHWVWAAGGWIFEYGALDFAGGAVVHINAGAAALAAVIVLGARRGYGKEPMPPHSLPFTVLGTGILWFGWTGFNAGSALAADGLAAQALMNTFVAASAALLGWVVVERLKDGHPTTLGAASGAVAGLVAITPCAGFVGTMPAMIIGFVAGGVCFLAIAIKRAAKLDDSLDVIAVHLVGGLIGSILLGLFADPAVNGAVSDPGLFIAGGGAALLVKQVVASGAVLVFSFVASFILMKAIDLVIGVRVTPEQEMEGLDSSLHAEAAYSMGDIAAGLGSVAHAQTATAHQPASTS
ncbi:MAG TPA: ammonium transporter [Acidimicrobiales bacterium]|nr:ammonium transporter [Acidimicrobiales bacterium]